MKKILVLVQNYPNNEGGVALMYVHVRNKYYIQHNIDVTVLNFSSHNDYIIENIKVITEDTYKKENKKYDVVVSHAANIRNHYRFLKKYENRFEHMIFFFHGHEVVKINEVYPEPYDYMKKNNWIRLQAQNCYDWFKLSLWHKYYKKIAYKTDFIFVSNWLYNEFQKYVKLSFNDLKGHVHIINNSVGKVFEDNSYRYDGDKKYDFITIRSYMDDSKYCVDLVDELAKKYPDYQFLIIGRGQYYKMHKIPSNVVWIDKFLNHDEIMSYIDQSKCGLLLTREDTQGVMTCELAEYGIPVITSDIEVCKEICGDLCNVSRIQNDIEKIDLKKVYETLIKNVPYEKQGKFSYQNTVKKEERLLGGRSKTFDFITIRNNMDSSTYCIDLVCKLAENNPNFSFLIIGKGTFFRNRCKPNNITWIDKYLKHEDILNCVNHARCALMPTRRDTQGVMSCELVTYGIPLITSDLPVCREIFGKIPTVAFMNNDIRNENLSQLYLNLLKKSRAEIDMFGYSNTVKREENIIKMEY